MRSWRRDSHRRAVFRALLAGRSRLRGRFGKKLLKIFEQVGRRVKQSGHLRVDVLNRFLFALVGLQDFEKLFIDFGFVLETVLEKSQLEFVLKFHVKFRRSSLHKYFPAPSLPRKPLPLMSLLANGNALTLILLT